MELKTKRALNYEAKNKYNIRITCTDLAPPKGGLPVEKLFIVYVTGESSMASVAKSVVESLTKSVVGG